jgi:hypothetical protein
MTAVLLVKGRGKIAVLTVVTAVLLHQSAMHKCKDRSVVSRG